LYAFEIKRVRRINSRRFGRAGRHYQVTVSDATRRPCHRHASRPRASQQVQELVVARELVCYRFVLMQYRDHHHDIEDPHRDLAPGHFGSSCRMIRRTGRLAPGMLVMSSTKSACPPQPSCHIHSMISPMIRLLRSASVACLSAVHFSRPYRAHLDPQEPARKCPQGRRQCLVA
jgi:hypothetical protein